MHQQIIISAYQSRQMIKHASHPLSKQNKVMPESTFNQFETFQFCQNEMDIAGSQRDSLLFSQSRKADDTNKQIGQILSSISKQDYRQHHRQKSRGSSIKKNKANETIKQHSQVEIVDPLAQYMVSSFEPRNSALHNNPSEQIKSDKPFMTGCQRCKFLEEEHRKELSFLTKNNLELYELNKKLSAQLNQFVKNYESFQKQLLSQKQQNSILVQQVQILKEEKEKLQQKYYQRQKTYLRQKEVDLKAHEKQLKIVEKISQCLQEKEKRVRQKSQKKSKPKTLAEDFKRTKTEYDGDMNNKQISTTATWEGSCMKYTPRKVEKTQQMYSDQKLRKQIDSKKKKILSKVAKENLTIEDLQTQIPQSALNKIGKGNVGKLTLAKSTLGRSSSFFHGTGSVSLAPTQKKYR